MTRRAIYFALKEAAWFAAFDVENLRPGFSPKR